MINLKNKNKYNNGQTLLFVVIFFLLISLTIIFSIIAPMNREFQVSRDYISSTQGFYLTEGAIEDVVYRIKNGLTVASPETLILDGYTATTTISNIVGGQSISTESSIKSLVRKEKIDLTTGRGVAFSYGIQAGSGGFSLMGGSRIVGNAFANGNIIATDGSVITGTAIAANSSALVADQVNNTPETPPNSINFRNASATQDFAQSFTVSSTGPVSKIQFYIKKVGSPADITVRIVADSGGSPSTTNLLTTNGTLLASNVSLTNWGPVEVVLPSNPELDSGTTYWIILDNSSQNSSNYYIMAANSSYSSGQAKIGKYAGTWTNTTPSGLDGYFNLFLGGLTAKIGGGSYVGAINIGQSGIGDAWAHTVTGASVAGTIYCQVGSSNNKACNTSRADPIPEGYPVSDANILDWKGDAVAGGTITGDLHVNYAGATLGPRKITGNLTVDGGGTLTVSGTLWVQGTVTVTGGGKVKLASSYGNGSGVIVSDGIVNLSGGATLNGSGQNGSYLLILTTSNCPEGPSCGGSNALSLTGGAGAVILNAQNGTMNLSGGVATKEATAYKMIISGGATITYEDGISNLNFSGDPTGGFNIVNWNEIQ
ncbi:MAG: choice-of-anchor R domain-containing protein [Candidatus Paceibacterota bacterium]